MPEALPNPVTPAIPPLSDPVIQAALDREHLRLLEIVFYIAGGTTALFSCIFLIHFTLFLILGLNPQMLANSPHGQQIAPPPAGLFLGFAAFIGVIILLGWTFGGLQIYAGRCLRNRRHRVLVFIVGVLECVFIPWGTVIGVCAMLVLSRSSVKALFN